MIENTTGRKDELNQRLIERTATIDMVKAQLEAMRTRREKIVSKQQVREYLEASRDQLVHGEYAAKRKIVETFVERIDVFRDRCEYTFRTDKLLGRFDGKVGGTKAGQTITITSHRKYWKRIISG